MRGRRTESRKTSSMLRNRMIGSDGSASPTAFAIDVCSVAAGSALRNMMCMLPSPNELPSRAPGMVGKTRGSGSSRKYSSVPAGGSTRACLTSFATPITVTQGFWSPKRGLTRRPIGAMSFQKVRTNVSFTSATGARELQRRGRGRPDGFAVIGRATADALGGADLVARVSTQEGLLAELPRPAGRVLFAGAESARRLLVDELDADFVPLYRTRELAPELPDADFVAAVDPVNREAEYRALEDVPLAGYDAVLACIPDEPKIEV